MAKKNMVIKVIMEGAENLALTIPQTRANVALIKAFGAETVGAEFRTLKVRNPHGRWGAKGKPVAKKVGRKTAATA